MTFIAPQAKVLLHMDRLAQLKANVRTLAPINAEIDLSNRCSLGCEWCHFAYTHTRGPLRGKRPKPDGAIAGGDLMELGLARSIVNQLSKAGVRSITWTGGGEPTLHPDFDKIVSWTALKKVSQALYTHGGHIDEARAALLKRTMSFVYVSLDAADPVAYKRDKGVDRFAKATGGVSLLAQAVGDATVGVGYLVTRENWRGASAVIPLAFGLGADYVQFRPTILYDQANPDDRFEQTAWLDEAIPALEALQGPGVEIDIDRFRMYRDWSGHGYESCAWSMLQTCITPNGKVWVCVNRREHAGAEIGDLSVDTFENIWRRHTMAKVNGDCRVMCRGHLANLAVNEVLADRPHAEFV